MFVNLWDCVPTTRKSRKVIKLQKTHTRTHRKQIISWKFSWMELLNGFFFLVFTKSSLFLRSLKSNDQSDHKAINFRHQSSFLCCFFSIFSAELKVLKEINLIFETCLKSIQNLFFVFPLFLCSPLCYALNWYLCNRKPYINAFSLHAYELFLIFPFNDDDDMVKKNTEHFSYWWTI